MLTDFILYLADSNLILSQRNAAWCGHGPVLEQDIAITNITLDVLGQARLFYQTAAERMNSQTGSSYSEDDLAYLRNEREFKNLLITELPRGDWGFTVLRQYLFSSYMKLVYEKLLQGSDEQLRAIAEKSLKEVSYHIRWSGEWVIRLGDGTEESHQRINRSLLELWPYTGEFFRPAAFEKNEIIGFDTIELAAPWHAAVETVLQQAMLTTPQHVFMHSGGKAGLHTEHMGFILTDLQYLQRTYPGAKW